MKVWQVDDQGSRRRVTVSFEEGEQFGGVVQGSNGGYVLVHTHLEESLFTKINGVPFAKKEEKK